MAWAPAPIWQPLSEALQQYDMLIAELGEPTEYAFFAREGGGMYRKLADVNEASAAAHRGVSVEIRLTIVTDRERAARAQEAELVEMRKRRREQFADQPREVDGLRLPKPGEGISVGEI